MKFKGKGQISHAGGETGEDFTIEGPVENIRLSFEVTKDVLTKTSGQSKIDFKDIDIKIDNSKVQIQSQSQAFNEHGHSDEVKNWVRTRLAEEIH